MNAARVQFAAALDVARGPHPETKIRFVGPIDLIVPTAFARSGVIGDLILLKAGRFQGIQPMQVHGQLGVFIEGTDLAQLSLLPQASSFFIGQAIRGQVIGL